jgi:predicted metal-dependent peptidase
MNKPDELDWLVTAKARVFKEAPYLGFALFRITCIEAPDLFVPGTKEPTLAVDKYWRMYYNPLCGHKWTMAEQAGAIYHELGHLCREHAERCEEHNFDPRNWNIAGDLEINDEQLPQGLRYPPNVLTPKRFGFPDGLLAEEYYERLQKQAEKNRGKGGQGQKGDKDGEGGGGVPWYGDGEGEGRPAEGNCGSCANGKDRSYQDEAPPSGSDQGVGKAEAERLRRDVAAKIKEASKDRGTVPAGWARWADVQLGEKQIDWRTLFRAAVKSSLTYKSGMGDYTYMRPSRRQSAVRDIILPGTHRPQPSVVLGVDTSGSMDDETLNAIVSEIKNILQVTELARLYVIACDAAIHFEGFITNTQKIKLGGGGGTDMRVIFEAVQKMRTPPQVLVLATDGYTPWPAVMPREYKTVIVKTTKDVTTPDWARTVFLDPYKNKK